MDPKYGPEAQEPKSPNLASSPSGKKKPPPPPSLDASARKRLQSQRQRLRAMRQRSTTLSAPRPRPMPLPHNTNQLIATPSNQPIHTSQPTQPPSTTLLDSTTTDRPATATAAASPTKNSVSAATPSPAFSSPPPPPPFVAKKKDDAVAFSVSAAAFIDGVAPGSPPASPAPLAIESPAPIVAPSSPTSPANPSSTASPTAAASPVPPTFTARGLQDARKRKGAQEEEEGKGDGEEMASAGVGGKAPPLPERPRNARQVVSYKRSDMLLEADGKQAGRSRGSEGEAGDKDGEEQVSKHVLAAVAKTRSMCVDEDDERMEEIRQAELERKRESLAVKRLRVENEILSTEASYVASMKSVNEHYEQPLLSDPKYGVSQQQLNNIFGKIPAIYGFHKVFQSELRQAHGNRHLLEQEGSSKEQQATGDVASVFLRNADFMKLYTQYLNHFDSAVATINDLRTNRAFYEFLAKKQSTLGNDLMSFLIMPVQRLPRYVLLLRELLSCTPATHPGHRRLLLALTKVENIAQHVNENKRQVENMNELLKIQTKVLAKGSCQLELLKPGRRLLKEGPLLKLSGGRFGAAVGVTRMRYFYLLTDVLLWTTMDNKMSGRTYVYLDYAVLKHEDSRVGSKHNPLTFELKPSSGSNKGLQGAPSTIRLTASDAQDKAIWLAAIGDALHRLERTRKQQKETQIVAHVQQRRNKQRVTGAQRGTRARGTTVMSKQRYATMKPVRSGGAGVRAGTRGEPVASDGGKAARAASRAEAREQRLADLMGMQKRYGDGAGIVGGAAAAVANEKDEHNPLAAVKVVPTSVASVLEAEATRASLVASTADEAPEATGEDSPGRTRTRTRPRSGTGSRAFKHRRSMDREAEQP